MNSVSLIAPAKVNLFLGIGPLQPDGYHTVVTVMHALALHDKLTISVKPLSPDAETEDGVRVTVETTWCEGIEPLEIDDADNLAARAVKLLAQSLGRTQPEHLHIELEKHIPYQAGLGGGSSDAAAALVGAALLWGLDPTDNIMCTASQSLGADVCFFQYGGCALLAGRGDQMVHSLVPMKDSVVVMVPKTGVSTAEAYALFDGNPVYPTEAQVQELYGITRAEDVPLFNNLDAPAEQLVDDLQHIHRLASEHPGVRSVQLSGSGSAMFALCDSVKSAHALSAAARAEGYWARTTSFSSAGASALPCR